MKPIVGCRSDSALGIRRLSMPAGYATKSRAGEAAGRRTDADDALGERPRTDFDGKETLRRPNRAAERGHAGGQRSAIGVKLRSGEPV